MKDDPLYELALKVGVTLSNHRYSLATAESCTGGWIAKAVTDIPGSSGWFERGFITYSNRSKSEQLDVAPALILECGAVSAEVVEAMARGALKYSPADVAVAVSGIAGPEGGNLEKPVGTVWFAWAIRADGQHRVHCEFGHFGGSRDKVRYAATERGLAGILEILSRS
ncbi:MAG TPA: CinA family protein [Gammaproteobacteria bacterium]|nr:CinA family protein [Gammaproteobacteria bacterium]